MKSKGDVVAGMKARHWAFGAMVASVMSIAWMPDPMDGFMIGATVALFWNLQEGVDD
jgi:hypothetical protein